MRKEQSLPSHKMEMCQGSAAPQRQTTEALKKIPKPFQEQQRQNEQNQIDKFSFHNIYNKKTLL